MLELPNMDPLTDPENYLVFTVSTHPTNQCPCGCGAYSICGQQQVNFHCDPFNAATLYATLLRAVMESADKYALGLSPEDRDVFTRLMRQEAMRPLSEKVSHP